MPETKVDEVKRILVVGAHGMLGRPVVRRLVKEGFAVRAMGRNPKRAQRLLPEEIEVVEGDLRSLEDIRGAAEGIQAVYLNLDTIDPKASFRAELDGTKNVIAALKDKKHILLSKISAIDAKADEKWPNMLQKWQADEALKDSGHPYIVFRPTWFMESLSIMVQGPVMPLFSGLRKPLHWLAGDDFGGMIAAALRDSKLWNATYDLTGPEPLTLKQAARRFIHAAHLKTLPVCAPTVGLKIASHLHPRLNHGYRLVLYSQHGDASFATKPDWQKLTEPKMHIEDYTAYMQKTNDYPRKSLFGTA